MLIRCNRQHFLSDGNCSIRNWQLFCDTMRQQAVRVASFSAVHPISNVIHDTAFPCIKILGCNTIHLAICFLGGFCCFLPLIFGVKSNMEETLLRSSLTNGRYFRDSSVASIAMATPLTLEIIIDLVIRLVRRIGIISTDGAKSQTSLNNIEKFLCQIGIIVVPLTAFLPDDLSNLTLIFICCNKCQSFIIGATVMISICRSNRNLWSITWTLTFLLLMTFAQITSTFSLNTAVDERHDPFNNSMVVASNISTFMAVAVLLGWSFHSLFYQFCKSYREAQPDETNSERHNRSNAIFSMCWLAIIIAGIAYLIAISSVYGSIEKWTGFALLLNNVAYLTLELSITILTMRMVKSDVVKSLVSSLLLSISNCMPRRIAIWRHATSHFAVHFPLAILTQIDPSFVFLIFCASPFNYSHTCFSIVRKVSITQLASWWISEGCFDHTCAFLEETVGTNCLFLSYLNLPDLILSYLVLFYLIYSFLALPHLVWHHFLCDSKLNDTAISSSWLLKHFAFHSVFKPYALLDKPPQSLGSFDTISTSRHVRFERETEELNQGGSHRSA